MNLVSDLQPDQLSLDESADLNYQQFLRFQIHPDCRRSLEQPLRWSIEIERVTELINIPIDRVVPIPHLPPAVIGVYNWRGEILWIVDLAMFLGVKTAGSPLRYRSLQPTIILTSADTSEDPRQKTIGFVVDEISEIEWCDLDLIQSLSPDHLYPECSSWARGMWGSVTGENYLILDGQKISDRAEFHADV